MTRMLGLALGLAACAPVPVDPRSDDAFARGMEAYLAGDTARANDLLAEVPEGHPYHGIAWAVSSRIFSDDLSRDFEAAVKSLSDGDAAAAARHVGDDPWNAGMRAYHLHDYPEAVRQLGHVPADHPDYAKAMRFAGYNVFVREWNRSADALPYLARAYRAAPDDEKVLEDAQRGFEKAGHAFPPDDATLDRLVAAPFPLWFVAPHVPAGFPVIERGVPMAGEAATSSAPTSCVSGAAAMASTSIRPMRPPAPATAIFRVVIVPPVTC